jgi:flagellar assembly factor FliW
MALIISRYFGTFDIHEREVVHFPVGLPGFEDQKDYAALCIPGQEPILYLQSLNRSELCLITLPARAFRHAYQLELSAEDRELLGFLSDSELTIGKDIACQVIVTMDQNSEPAANLVAPLVINLSNHHAVQVFLAGADYSFHHPLAEELRFI